MADRGASENKLRLDFGDGTVIYNEFDIDFTIPYEMQIDNLTEDLVQAEYKNGVLLDIGWYLEMNPEGQFVIQVIGQFDWDNPIFKESAKTEDELLDVIERAVEVAERSSHEA